MIQLQNIAMLAWLAPVAMMWGQARDFVMRLGRLLIRTETFEAQLTPAMEVWLMQNCRKVPGVKSWAFAHVYNRKGSGRPGAVVADAGDARTVYFHGWRMLIWNVSNHAVTYLWGTFKTENVLRQFGAWRAEVIAERERSSDRDFGDGFMNLLITHKPGRGMKVESTRGQRAQGLPGEPIPSGDSNSGPRQLMESRWGYHSKAWWNSGISLAYDDRPPEADDEPEVSNVLDNGYYHTDETMAVVDDMREFLSAREWYSERFIPWRRGLLLSGPPGTGKSMLALALARRFDMPLISLDLHGMSAEELNEVRGEVLTNRRSLILLIEDIDNLFDGRKNVTANSIASDQLSFDSFLQFLGGVQDNSGWYVIITTNDKSKLDSALIRPGRIDVQLDMKGMTREHCLGLANTILRDWPGEAEALFAETSEYPIPAAGVVDKCVLAAMKHLNKKIHAA